MVSAAAVASPRTRNYEIATHWQLMWWKFRRHHMAILGLSLLGIFLIIALVPEFLSPYGTHTRNLRYAQGPPMGFHFFDSTGTFHARPFVYGWKSKRDAVTAAPHNNRR